MHRLSGLPYDPIRRLCRAHLLPETSQDNSHKEYVKREANAHPIRVEPNQKVRSVESLGVAQGGFRELGAACPSASDQSDDYETDDDLQR